MDGYSLNTDFGIYVSSRSGTESVGKRIEIATTLPYLQNKYRELRYYDTEVFNVGYRPERFVF